MTSACLFSGGKDSTLALHRAASLGIRIDLLITMRSSNPDSYMFHYPNIGFTAMQADALGIRQVFASTEGKKEEELKDLEEALRASGAELLVTGATYSEYQGSRINSIAKKLGIEHLAPLWHINPLEELGEIAERFDAIITSVSAEGFDESFLGKKIDREMIGRLTDLNKRHGINMLFEGGEAESFVLDAPMFRKGIAIKSARKEYRGTSGRYIIKEAEFVDKD